MGVKGNNIGNSHSLQFLQRAGAVQGFPVAAAVLAPAVQQGHNHADPVGLSAGGLN